MKNKMKQKLSHAPLSLALSLVAFTGASARASAPEAFSPDRLPTQVSTAYIPDGFDSNDNSQVVVEGIFPNTCFRPTRTEFVVDRAAKQIHLQPQALYYDGFCLQMLVPYDQTVDLGLLPAGEYTVVQEETRSIAGLSSRALSTEDALGTLKVRPATQALADDFLYAPVDQAFVEKIEGKGAKIRLSGAFTNSCAKLSEIRVSPQKNVIVVQPITEMHVKPGFDCQNGRFPFTQEIQAPSEIHGRTLVHVRSLNGKSLNTLIDL